MLRLFLPVLALVASHIVFAQQNTSETDRLVSTGKLWITVKYFHPYLAYKDLDWDQALVNALPKIRRANNSADYAAAIQSMLDALDDPSTYVLPELSKQAAAPIKIETRTDRALPAPGQRTWVHDAFHSAFYTTAGPEIGKTTTLDMGQGVKAVIRLSEPVFPDGTGLPEISTLDSAPQAATRKLLPPYPSPQPDRAYAATPYPSTELRILAAYKIWGVFHYFFAYRDQMDEDWDDLLPVFLPKFIAAKGAREYNLAISEMVAHAADSQATVESEELSDYFGRTSVGLRLRLVDKKPVITEVLDEDATKAGIRAGDIVTKLDGESIVPRINDEARYISSATRQWLGYRVMQRLLNGPEGSTAALTIASQDGQSRDVSLKRSSSYSVALRNQRNGDAIKLLGGNIGYADLDRLTDEEVDPMFEKFRNTKAIIFDMRGDPRPTAPLIAPRLTDRHDVAAAIITGPLTLSPDIAHGDRLTSSASYFFVQKLPASDKWKYKRKTVMLIDERTIGEGERIGLSLEAANKTEFIGTPSDGANGETGSFVVPGGITIHFSGQDVRHANGGQLQRLGLQPAVSVPPSLDDIRRGRDEVLEKAIEYVSGRAATGERRAVARRETTLLQ